ncbi:MAG TPA: mitochondrial fission ELM1 family protein [Dongiaceae bacterium]|nr:mitochondrial fission ELM1 family protein [Dongiaceae bacterium]
MVSEEKPVSDKAVPRVWLLTGFRAGDKAQMVALAEALGWPFEIKRLAYRPYEFVTNILLGMRLAGLDRRRSDQLAPPWPDLVITAGRRNEPVARWIKEQNEERTVVVHLGRPWSKVAAFDLVVTTPQYNVPPLPNVLQIDLPLHGVTPARLQAAGARWQGGIAALPQPRIAVLVGGDSPPYVFDAPMARRLARQASDFARRRGGSLLVATSPRTKPEAAAALQAAIDVPCQFYRWSPEPDSNPYLGFLAVADTLIVTGDSMSMVAEACATGKAVYVFDLGYGWTRMRAAAPQPSGSGVAAANGEELPSFRAKRLLHWLIAHGLPRRIRRDVRKILLALAASGRIGWLDDQDTAPQPAPSTDLAAAAARVQQLFDPARRR